ncbi:MAG: HAMP domain-containing histidine kinase, partial [Rhodospirillaceae bacterium]|nr:HAMP domain-containing histidine kinase [Rhodospirillaceae bacterium]
FAFMLSFSFAWAMFIRKGIFSILEIPEPVINLPIWVFALMSTIFSVISIVVLMALGMGIMRYLSEREKDLIAGGERQRSFAADAAHELRTPLTVLRAQIESMEDKKTANALLEDVDRITHIIEQILDKSRFEVLKVDKDEMADLSEICTSVVSYLAPLVINDGRSIELLGTDKPVLVNGNSFALEQAVKNLISNASRYSSRGSMITVEVASGPVVRVIDRGRGVPEEDREAIFERFRRADRRGGGAGLGLAIVKSVTEAHGGSVGVDDAPGGGSVFTIAFPPQRKQKNIN